MRNALANAGRSRPDARGSIRQAVRHGSLTRPAGLAEAHDDPVAAAPGNGTRSKERVCAS
jgi:hypothetical protein